MDAEIIQPEGIDLQPEELPVKKTRTRKPKVKDEDNSDALKKVSTAHIRYKTSTGAVVPGTTTITGLLAKPFLITWANRLGLEGIDSTKYRDEAADIGTLAHAMVQAHLQKETLDFTNYTALQIDLASNAVLSYYECCLLYTSPSPRDS